MPSALRRLLDPGPVGPGPGAGLLILRLAAAMMASHGWGKVTHFSEYAAQFPDPLHVTPTISLCLTIFAEFFCSIAVLAGLATRVAAGFVAFTMAVAGFVILSGKPFEERELAFVFFVLFTALVFTGAGRFSLDALIARPGQRL